MNIEELDISVRLVLVAARFGGFFDIRTIYFGEHMINTSLDDRVNAFKECLAKGWLKPTGGRDYFLDTKGWEEVITPIRKSYNIIDLNIEYEINIKDWEKDYYKGLKFLNDLFEI